MVGQLEGEQKMVEQMQVLPHISYFFYTSTVTLFTLKCEQMQASIHKLLTFKVDYLFDHALIDRSG